MKRYLAPLGALALLLGLACPVSAEVDECRAHFVPWSGYWWPIRKGEIVGPLHKYDTIAARHSAAWEAKNKPRSQADPWWGYCHAWSAASIFEREPRAWTNVLTPSRHRVALSVGDQKALLTVLHDADPSTTYGQRYYGQAGEDYQDIYPDVLWKCLRTHVKKHGVPLVLDISAGAEVWNYPVYYYRIDYHRTGGDGQYQGFMKLLMADDAVGPDYVGTKIKTKTYQFTFQMRQGALVVGSARWLGASTRDHPDFAWYPTAARPTNPEIQVAQVHRILRLGRPRDLSDLDPHALPPEPAAGPPDLEDIEAGRAIPVSSLELVTLLVQSPAASGLRMTANPLAGGKPASGKPYAVRGVSAQEGYVYLFDIAPDGELQLLFPMPGQENRVSKGKEFEFGTATSKARFAYPSMSGVHRLRALVTTQALVLDRLEDMQAEGSGQPAAQGRRFAWEPIEKEVVRDILKAVADRRRTPQQVEQETGVDPRKLLKSFAVQEVAVEVPARK